MTTNPTASRPTHVDSLDPQNGECLSVIGDTYRILMSGQDTNGAYATIDMLIPPGGGPGPHAHADIEEFLFVVEGELVFRSETQTYTAKKGALVAIHRGGAIHSFKNESGKVARAQCTVVPAGLEEFFEEIGKSVQPGTFLPPPEMTPATQQQMSETAKKYGQEVFPPDYLDHQKGAAGPAAG